MPHPNKPWLPDCPGVARPLSVFRGGGGGVALNGARVTFVCGFFGSSGVWYCGVY
ncbi:MAG: hypothetical protein JHC64_26320 [Mycolicibacterium sp.]|nr:hypothetical protein [Mycolicibacterium sp.]